MDTVCIPSDVLSSIRSIACEPLERCGLTNLKQAEQYCGTWLSNHPQLMADEQRVHQLERAGFTRFEAMRRTAAVMSARAWIEENGGPEVAATPVPEYAADQPN